VLSVKVKAANSAEWITTISVNGTYNGPTEIVLCKDYQLKWIINDHSVLELGTSVLEASSGESVRQVWSSIITPEETSGKVSPALSSFPSSGELINATVSRFQVDGGTMQYEWEGTVRKC
jgi:hypothetical protein